MARDLAQFAPVEEQIEAGGITLTVVRPASAEDLIDEDDYERDERLPYWAELWPSAPVLADVIAEADLAGRRVLELGCGIGVPSLVARSLGADVLATDWYAAALDFVAANAERAGLDVPTLLADWRDPPAPMLAVAPYDLVMAADVLYEPRNGEWLAGLLPRLCGTGTEVVITDPRRPGALAFIDRMAAAGWGHRREDRRVRGRIDEAGPVIHVHRLSPPSGPAATTP